MDIQTQNPELVSTYLREDVGLIVLDRVLDDTKTMVGKLLESLPPLPEDSGVFIDLLA